MKITNIEKQQNDKRRYNIFLDGSFAFGIYDETLLKFGLRCDDVLDEEKISEIKQSDEFNFGKKIAYSYLAFKSRSKTDLIKRLKSKKISEDTIGNVIHLLEEQEYLNDEIFAKNYLESKLSTKPVGKRLLQLKLLEKGIDKETTEKTINDNYSQQTETEAAERLLKKYQKNLRAKNKLDKNKKSYRYLISRGFDSEIISKVVNLDNEV
jgi:regulatory protein